MTKEPAESGLEQEMMPSNASPWEPLNASRLRFSVVALGSGVQESVVFWVRTMGEGTVTVGTATAWADAVNPLTAVTSMVEEPPR